MDKLAAKAETETRTHLGRRPSRPSRIILPMLGFAAVMSVAGTLRFDAVTKVGIRYDDEGAFATDARLWHRCAKVLMDGDAIRATLAGDEHRHLRRDALLTVGGHGVGFLRGK